MKKINRSTKQAKHFINLYNNTPYRYLRNVYKNYSYAKYCAELLIISQMNKLNGYGYTILTYSDFKFTCAFIYEQNENKILRVYTKENTYEIIL